MLDVRQREEHISDLAFDQWFAHSVEPARQERLQAHVGTCVRCALRHQALANQRAAFLERVPSWSQLNAAHAVRMPELVAARSRRPWLAGAAFATVAVAALLVLAVMPAAQPPAVRSKGGPHIGAFVKRGEQVTRADDGSAVRAGDFVRFTYTSDRPVHFALLNRDRARASTYYPLAPTTTLVAAGHDVPLDFSIKLDAEPGAERVYGLFCDRQEALEPLRAALQARGELPALPHCHVDQLRLEKARQ